MSAFDASSFSLLFAPTGSYLDRDESAPMLFAVWCPLPDGDFDIIGAGNTADDAIDDARATVRGWSQS